MENKTRKKRVRVLNEFTFRDLVNSLNALNIGKEDIISVFKEDGSMFVLYYK